jgi:xylose isomerase
VQEAMAASGITELAQPTIADGESVADLLADDSSFESYDADKSAEHSYAFVHLNQLAVEHALGGR